VVHYALHPRNHFPTEAAHAWWMFSPDLLVTSGVNVVIVVFDSCALVPIVKLCLFLLHSLITVAYSCLREFCST
jgi:hypothetical protein